MLAVGEQMLGRRESNWIPIAAGLGGGVGDSQQEMCGAFSGGVLLIGQLFGPPDRRDSETDNRLAGELAAQYRERFLERFGATQCAPLRQRIETGGWLTGCDALVERATEILLTLLADARAR